MVEPYYTDEWVTLYHGEDVDVLPSMVSGSIGAIITDPPYNVSHRNGRDGTTPGRLRRADGTARTVRRDFGAWDRDWLPGPFIDHARRLLRESGSLVAFTSEFLMADWLSSGLNHRNLIVWHKTNPPPQFPKLYVRSTEFAVWQVNGLSGWVFNDGGYRHDCYEGPIVSASERVHPTQKPVWLMRALVTVHTAADDVVLDPYAGSGSTLVACRDLSRRVIGVERDERYCEAIANRLAQDVLPLGLEAS